MRVWSRSTRGTSLRSATRPSSTPPSGLDSLLRQIRKTRWVTRSLGSSRTSCWPVLPLVSPRPWLHQEGVGHRGYCPLLERKPCERAEVLPHPGPELCLQGHHQSPVRHPQGCLSHRQVCHEHCLWWFCRNPVPSLRVLP